MTPARATAGVVPPPAPRRSRRAVAILAMARPDQLALVTAIMLLGVASGRAGGTATSLLEVTVGIAVLLPVAASIHHANEYADHETDALTSRTPFSGGSGTLARTGLPPLLALRAAQVAAAAGLGTASLAWAAGLLDTPALVVLAAGAGGGWAYSVGPYPLAWHGFGEVINGVLGGMLLPLYGVAVAGRSVDPGVIAAFLPLMLVVIANLLATTWPDRAADAAVGKRTLATRWPTRRLRVVYLALVGSAVGALILQAAGSGSVAVAVAGLTATPLLAIGAVTYTRWRSALPTVAGMVWLVVAQMGASLIA